MGPVHYEVVLQVASGRLHLLMFRPGFRDGDLARTLASTIALDHAGGGVRFFEFGADYVRARGFSDSGDSEPYSGGYLAHGLPGRTDAPVGSVGRHPLPEPLPEPQTTPIHDDAETTSEDEVAADGKTMNMYHPFSRTHPRNAPAATAPRGACSNGGGGGGAGEVPGRRVGPRATGGLACSQSLAPAPPSAPPSPPGGGGLPVAGEMHLERRLPGPRAAGRRGGWAMAFAVLASLVCPSEQGPLPRADGAGEPAALVGQRRAPPPRGTSPAGPASLSGSAFPGSLFLGPAFLPAVLAAVC